MENEVENLRSETDINLYYCPETRKRDCTKAGRETAKKHLQAQLKYAGKSGEKTKPEISKKIRQNTGKQANNGKRAEGPELLKLNGVRKV